MKPDEAALLKALYADFLRDGFIDARQASQKLGIREKRAMWIYQKWSRRGWYECASLMAGWLTDAGKAEAARMIATEKQT